MKALSALASVLVLALTGCGYAFQGAKTALPPTVQKIYVPLAENNTAEVGVSQLLTEAIKDKLERFGVLTIVDSESEADAVLKTTITKITSTTRTTTGATDRALQYDNTMTIAGQLRTVEGKLLWSTGGLRVSKVYGATSNVVTSTSADFTEGTLSASDLAGLDSKAIQRSQQGATMSDLALEAARKIYDQAIAADF